MPVSLVSVNHATQLVSVSEWTPRHVLQGLGSKFSSASFLIHPMSAVSHCPFQRSWDREARAVIALSDGDPATRVPRGKRILHASTALSRTMLVQAPGGSFKCRWPPPLYSLFNTDLCPAIRLPDPKTRAPSQVVETTCCLVPFSRILQVRLRHYQGTPTSRLALSPSPNPVLACWSPSQEK